MNSDIKQLLESVQSGQTSVDEALMQLKMSPFEDIGFPMALLPASRNWENRARRK